MLRAMKILSHVKPSEHSMPSLLFSGVTLERLDRKERLGLGRGACGPDREA